jgi:transcriptional regulator with GAF, ATPase, and Fis domain
MISGGGSPKAWPELRQRICDLLAMVDARADDLCSDPDDTQIDGAAREIRSYCAKVRQLLPRELAPSPAPQAPGVPTSTPAPFDLPVGDRPEQVVQEAAQRIAANVDADLVLVLRVLDDGAELRQLARAASHPKHSRSGVAEEAIAASRSVLDHCCLTQEPEFIVDTLQVDRYRQQASVVNQQIRSVLVAPILDHHNQLYALVYADRRSLFSSPFGVRERQTFDRIVTTTAEALRQSLQMAAPDLGRDRSKRRTAEALRHIIGTSPALRQAKGLCSAFAQSHAPVLLIGERGTGKELFAQAIHRLSPWHQGKLIRLQGPMLQGETGHAEIRGWTRGAFTGADQAHSGAFETAASGTLFIDEVADLDARAQAALLGALDPGTIRRIGETHDRPVTARIIAATNQDLERLAAEGRFRLDLLDRLSALQLRLPPLRERHVDIIELFRHFLDRCDLPLEMRPHGLTAEAESWILSLPLEGNVRELKNLAIRGAIMAAFHGCEKIDREHLTNPNQPLALPWPRFKKQVLAPLDGEERVSALDEWLRLWHRETRGNRRLFRERAMLSESQIAKLLREVSGGTPWHR